MPGIQDIYSVNVTNRFDIGGDDDDAADDYDPLDTLKSLEDEKKRAAEEAKKKKQSLASKGKNQKKPVRFQENKESNIPARKETTNNTTQKSTKPPRQQSDRTDGPVRGNNRRAPRDRQNFSEGDENRRPPRRRTGNDREQRNDYGNARGEGFDQQVKTDGGFGRPAGNDYGPRKDRAERYRGSRGGFGNNRGQSRNVGGYRNDGRDDRGKREFDRRSGSDRTSVKATDKRDGAGPRNWGTPGNEIEDSREVEPVGTWTEQADNEETEKTEKTEEDGAGDDDKEPKTDEPAEMTLDEWRAKQDGQNKPAFNIRKPGEGEDQEKWKGLKVLRKVNAKNEGKRDMASDEHHRRQTKPQFNVNIQFGDNARGFGGRGRGRGMDRGRGGRGRGGGRYSGGGDRGQRQYMPDVQNEQEFPTLG